MRPLDELDTAAQRHTHMAQAMLDDGIDDERTTYGDAAVINAVLGLTFRVEQLIHLLSPLDDVADAAEAQVLALQRIADVAEGAR